MYLCRELTELSLPKIGQQFGGRDHTTVMHADRKIRQMMSERRNSSSNATRGGLTKLKLAGGLVRGSFSLSRIVTFPLSGLTSNPSIAFCPGASAEGVAVLAPF
jgi:hypothetical protein